MEQGLISEKLYEKCSKPHIQSLPGDLRTTDSNKLNERLDKINKEINNLEKDIKKNNQELQKQKKKINNAQKGIDSVFKDIEKKLKEDIPRPSLSNPIADTAREFRKEIDKLKKDYKKAIKNINNSIKKDENFSDDLINKLTGDIDDLYKESLYFEKYVRYHDLLEPLSDNITQLNIEYHNYMKGSGDNKNKNQLLNDYETEKKRTMDVLNNL